MALVYSRSFLKAISTSVLANQPRCSFDLRRRLTDYGISRLKLTRRGCLRGQRKCRTLPKCQPPQSKFSEDLLHSLDMSSVEESSVNEVEDHFHSEMREALNIQDNPRHPPGFVSLAGRGRNHLDNVAIKRTPRLFPPKRSLNFGNVNARFLRNKTEGFTDHVIESKLDICVVKGNLAERER